MEGDAAVFLHSVPSGSFDVVVVDSSSISFGPGSTLSSPGFYSSCARALRHGGVFVSQTSSYHHHLTYLKAVVKACRGIFGMAEYAHVSVPTFPTGTIGFVIGRKGGGSCKVPKRILEEEVQREMEVYDAEFHRGCFVLPRKVKEVIEGKV